MSKSGLIDLEVQVHAITERAIRVSDDGEDKNAVWLPLSQIEVENPAKKITTITVPEWLAEQRGLI